MKNWIILKDEYDNHPLDAQQIIDYLILTDILLNKFGLDNKVHIECNPTGYSSVLGCYRYDISLINDRKFEREIILEYKYIHNNKNEVINTICHEVAHAIQHDIKGYTDHDELFWTIHKAILPDISR